MKKKIKLYNNFNVFESLEESKKMVDILKFNLLDLSDDIRIEFYDSDGISTYLKSGSSFGHLYAASEGRKLAMVKYYLPSIKIHSLDKQIEGYKKRIDFLEDFNVAISRTVEEFGELDIKIISNDAAYFLLIGKKKI